MTTWQRVLFVVFAAIAPFCVIYLLTAFTYWNIDASQWGEDGRWIVSYLGGALGLPCAFCAFCALLATAD